MGARGHVMFNRPGDKPRELTYLHVDLDSEGDNVVIEIPEDQSMTLFYFAASNGGADMTEVVTKWGGTYRFGAYLKNGAAVLMNLKGAEPELGKGNDFIVYLGADCTMKISVGYLMYDA